MRLLIVLMLFVSCGCEALVCSSPRPATIYECPWNSTVMSRQSHKGKCRPVRAFQYGMGFCAPGYRNLDSAYPCKYPMSPEEETVCSSRFVLDTL